MLFSGSWEVRVYFLTRRCNHVFSCCFSGSREVLVYFFTRRCNHVFSCCFQGPEKFWYIFLLGGVIMFFHVVFQGPEKFWYIFLLGGVIIFQCITTDIFVFHVLSDDSSNIIPPVANKTTIFPAISIRTGSTVPTYYGHWENSLLHNWLKMYMSFHLYYIYIANIL
jgi:lipid-A-disaccharide synthase-like uncharacterized protein